MLTERERATRDALLSELGRLPKDGTRGTGEDLDPDLLDRRMAEVRREQRRRLRTGAACFVYVLAALGALGLKLGQWTPSVLVLVGLLWLIAACQQYEQLRARSAIYRALKALTAHGGQAPAAPDRVEREAL